MDAGLTPNADAGASQLPTLTHFSSPGIERVNASAVDDVGNYWLAGTVNSVLPFGSEPSLEFQRNQAWIASFNDGGTVLFATALKSTLVQTTADQPRAHSLVPDGNGGIWALFTIAGPARFGNTLLENTPGERRDVLLHIGVNGALIGSPIYDVGKLVTLAGNKLVTMLYATPGESIGGLPMTRLGWHLAALNPVTGQGEWVKHVFDGLLPFELVSRGDMDEVVVFGTARGVLSYDGEVVLNFIDDVAEEYSDRVFAMRIGTSAADMRKAWWVDTCLGCGNDSYYASAAAVGTDLAIEWMRFTDLGAVEQHVARFDGEGNTLWAISGDTNNSIGVHDIAANASHIALSGRTHGDSPFANHDADGAIGPVVVVLDAADGHVAAWHTTPLHRPDADPPWSNNDDWDTIALTNDHFVAASGLVGPLLIDDIPTETDGLTDLVITKGPLPN